MNCNHELVNERGENYCRKCGEVDSYDVVSTIIRTKPQNRFANGYLLK